MATQTDNLRIVVDVDGEGQVTARLAKVGDGLGGVEQKARGASDAMRVFGTVIGAIGVERLVSGLVSTVAEFERLGAVLRTMEGSQGAATMRLRELQDIASKTPSSLREIVEAFTALKARGLDPSREALLAYANVAAATGRSLQQFVEAVGDAAFGEMERLKEFGVVARQEGDKIAFTFQGVTTVVARNAQAVEEYLQNIGRVTFAGAASEQMNTLLGAFSNFTDELEKLAVAIGDAGIREGLTDIVRGLGVAAAAAAEFVDETDTIETILKAVGVTAGATGAIITARLLAPVVTTGGAFLVAATQVNTYNASLLVAVARTQAMAVASRGAAAALALVGGPAGIALLGAGAIAYLATRQSEAAEAADALAEAMDRLEGSSDDQRLAALQHAEAERARAMALLETARAELERRRAFAENIGATNPGTDRDWASRFARTRANDQADDVAALEQQLARLDEKIAQSRQSYQAWIDAVNAGPPALDAAGRSAGELEKATKALIERLREQVATYGLSRVELLEYERAQALATTADAAARDTLGQLYDKLIAKVRAEEDNAKRTERAARAERDRAAAMRESLEVMEDIQRQGQDVLDRLFPEIAAQRQLQGDESALRDSMLAGFITPAQFEEAMRRLRAPAEDAGEDIGEHFVDGFQAATLNATDALQGALIEGLLEGNWDDVGERLAKTILAGFLDAWLSENVTGPLQDWLMQTMSRSSRGASVPASSEGIFSGGMESGSGNGYSAGGVASGAMTGYAIGGSMFGGSSQNRTGGMIGGAIGSYFGPLGEMIGSIIGSLIGELFESTPSLEVSSRPENINRSRIEASGTSRLGSIYLATEDMDFDREALLNAILKLDNALASLLDPSELSAAREALADFDVNQRGRDIDPEEVLSLRVNEVFRAVLPEFAQFLKNIDDLEERIRAFEGIRALQRQIEDLDDVTDSLSLDPLVRLRAELRALDDQVETTAQALEAAIAEQDPAMIAQAAAAAQDAVIRRYQAEIQLVLQLRDAIEQAQQQAFQLSFGLAQRIQATGGTIGGATAIAAAQIPVLQQQVLSETDPTRALQFLDRFIGTVDAWLNQAIADADALLAAEQERINLRLSELNEERQGIMANAQARMQADAAYARIAQEAENARRQALQEQLRLAQEWIGVLQSAEQLTRSLTFGTSNPLSGFARLSLLDTEIARREADLASADEGERAGIASDLLGLLEQRIGLVQQEGLFDRPSGEFLQVFNDTLRRIGAVRELAEPEVDRAEQLQAELAALQREGNSYSASISSSVSLTYTEQQRLREIAEEEQQLAEELAEAERIAQETREEAMRQANAYYTWAQGEALKLQEARDAQLRAQLDEITGGRPVDQFIAERQAETVGLLTQIRDDLGEFLAAISNLPPNFGGRPSPPGEPPISNPFPQANSSVVLQPTINITAGPGTDGAAIGRQVSDALTAQLPQLTSQIKRELAIA